MEIGDWDREGWGDADPVFEVHVCGFLPTCGFGGDECGADFAVDVQVGGPVVLVQGGAAREGEWAFAAEEAFVFHGLCGFLGTAWAGMTLMLVVVLKNLM